MFTFFSSEAAWSISKARAPATEAGALAGSGWSLRLIQDVDDAGLDVGLRFHGLLRFGWGVGCRRRLWGLDAGAAPREPAGLDAGFGFHRVSSGWVGEGAAVVRRSSLPSPFAAGSDHAVVIFFEAPLGP